MNNTEQVITFRTPQLNCKFKFCWLFFGIMTGNIISKEIPCFGDIRQREVCVETCTWNNSVQIACNFSEDVQRSAEYKDSLAADMVIRIVAIPIFVMIIILGIIGNILVLKVIWSNKRFRSVTNVLLGSLAVTDLLFIAFCVPFTAMYYTAPQMAIWSNLVQNSELYDLPYRIYQFLDVGADIFSPLLCGIASSFVSLETKEKECCHRIVRDMDSSFNSVFAGVVHVKR